MPAKKGGLWRYYHQGGKQNSSHYKAYCLGCLNVHRPASAGTAAEPMDIDSDSGDQNIGLGSEWFTAALDVVKPVLGVKEAMIAHLIGAGRCPNASKEARAEARKVAGKAAAAEEEATDGGDESDAGAPAKKRKRIQAVEKSFKQSQLKVFKGIDIPFTDAQSKIIKTQFLRATISANLPFRWVVNPEVIKLFLMFRSAATAVIPDSKVLAGRLLNEESKRVGDNIDNALKGRYVMISTDGWKPNDKKSLTGVDACVDGKSHLIDVIQSSGKPKDGESMCNAFFAMIDKAEAEHGCIVAGLCCDNDGGSHKGRDLMVERRPWLFGPPCCGHQGQLMLVDYFKVNESGAQTAEDTTDVLGWIVGHERVRDIFDQAQVKKNGGTARSYLIANITRWTTHSIAFHRLIRLKAPIREAAITKRAEIIAAQVGAEKNKKTIKKMTETASRFCDLLDNPLFWKDLVTVAEDIEPICYITNINQSDSTRADQVLLGFAGVYLHFKRHSNPVISAGMMTRIEKRWAALDQPMFVFCLILNPYERVERFGPRAGTDAFTLSMALVELYRRVKSRPPSGVLSEEEKIQLQSNKKHHEGQVSKAFLQYLSSTGPFAPWEKTRNHFETVNGNDPILVWQQYLPNPDLHELADFAILLLGLSINQGGNERDFSDFKIKKTRLRNRLGTKKIGADIRASHKAEGLFEQREKRKNHTEERVRDLLAVPRYADALESGDEDMGGGSDGGKPKQVLVKSKAGWQKVFLKWVLDAREAEGKSDCEEEDAAEPTRVSENWLPLPLSKLFGEDAPRPVDHRTRRRGTFDRETLLMELLAAEHSSEEPDDGELSGSGDNYGE
ncbi:DUF659 domain-containing protein [Mycena venus]|uniref:DUF659 domain-containing protein n=1 Tax=Mycena venus TaxID=2733690 RepID=A0A8H6X2Q1_9AGAR|nr:DUF659 domain-containing protein [Mycena venus]